jgi:hypothetical protein
MYTRIYWHVPLDSICVGCCCYNTPLPCTLAASHLLHTHPKCRPFIVAFWVQTSDFNIMCGHYTFPRDFFTGVPIKVDMIFKGCPTFNVGVTLHSMFWRMCFRSTSASIMLINDIGWCGLYHRSHRFCVLWFLWDTQEVFRNMRAMWGMGGYGGLQESVGRGLFIRWSMHS